MSGSIPTRRPVGGALAASLLVGCLVVAGLHGPACLDALGVTDAGAERATAIASRAPDGGLERFARAELAPREVEGASARPWSTARLDPFAGRPALAPVGVGGR